MNRYYGIYAALLFSLCSLQAMEIDKKPLITGSLFIDGPAIYYGPGAYYYYNIGGALCTNDFNIETFEPLVKVKVIIDDKDKDNNYMQSCWTSNIPHIIRKLETQFWQNGTNDRVLDQSVLKIIEKKRFPSYMPVRLLKDVTQSNNTLELVVHLYDVSLKCMPNPSYNLIDQINDFIVKGPKNCFTCKTEGSLFNPIEELLKQQFIKEVIKEAPKDECPEEKGDLFEKVKGFFDDITRTNDQREEAESKVEEWIKEALIEEGHCEEIPLYPLYEHGEKGKEVVEQLKVTFAHLRLLIGTVLLWPQPETMNILQ